MKKKKQTKPKNKGTRTGKEKRGKTVVAADDAWESLLKIREKLGKGLQNDKSSVEILSEMRR